jgi:hypothetical protein
LAARDITTTAGTPWMRAGAGDTLGVVAGRGADQALGLVLGAHVSEHVQGPANLVGAGLLEEFGLQIDLGPGERIQGRRANDGRPVDMRLDVDARAVEVLKRQKFHRPKSPFKWRGDRLATEDGVTQS